MRGYIETERLILRNLVEEDADAVFKWVSDPEVNRYVLYPLYKNTDQVRAWIRSIDIDDPDFYEYGFVLKSTGELFGCGGLTYRPELNAWDLGYNIRKDFWGKGYTLEAVNAILDYIRQNRTVNAIEGRFASENSKSGRVMEKLGMTFNRDTVFSKFDGSVTYQGKIYRRDF